MHVDEERDAEGNVTRQGQDYYLKPMNCPMHNLVYRSRGRSYRELPLRLFEFGHVYRYEKSGVVHGLTRARGFTQDDAHIYTTREQMRDELASLLTFVLDLLRDYGLDDFYLELSTRDPEKSVGDDATWEEATRTLEEVATASGLELVPDPGGAAFYGPPKISVQAKDAIGRTWQLSTIQLDFFEPELFELEYTASDGTRQRPVMIHRALFGSIERFFGVLLEHYAGAFPVWLAPVQVVGIPVAGGVRPPLSGGDRCEAAGTRRPRRGRLLRRSHAEEDPYTHQGEGALPAHRRRRGPGEGRGVLPHARRVPGQRHPCGRGGGADRRRDPRQGAGVTGGTRDSSSMDASSEPDFAPDPDDASGSAGGRPALEDARDFAGDPDGIQRLWTPHRMVYIEGENKPADPHDGDQCPPFCAGPRRSDEDALIVHRGRTAYAILNLYPYNSGHLMVCPYRHVADYTELTEEEVGEVASITRTAMRVIREVSHPDGFNLGMNQGPVAGAGIAAHLHQHVVPPRWLGDANFLPIVGRTKAVPIMLAETRRLYGGEAWPKPPLG